MADTLELDYETKSDRDIDLGLDVYTRASEFGVLMGTYSLNRGPWIQFELHKGRPVPREFVEAMQDSDVEKWAYNSAFERLVTKRGLNIITPVKGWRCTMVLASLMSFAGKLEQVGKWIGLDEDKQKLQDGKRLLKLFTQPHKVTKNDPHRWHDWDTDPLEWENFCGYNVQDCVAERAVKDRLIKFPVPAAEWELYELDQIINDRGKPINPRFVANAIQMYERRKRELTSEMQEVTGLGNPGSPVQLTAWLKTKGYPFNDIGKDTVKKVLTMNLTGEFLEPDALKALKLRQWQARTSVKKFDAILARDTGDHSIRHMLQMAGAGRTARWAGRGPQPQNLTSTPDFLQDYGVLRIVSELIEENDYDALSLFSAEPMEILVGTVRSSFQTPDGYEFKCADLSSIESATLGWLAKCRRLLEVFAKGLDPYKDFATVFYGIRYDDVSKGQRKICKPPTLGCGYRLGGGNLTNDGKRTGLWGYAENMGVDMPREESHRAVKVFRETYVEIPQFWKALELAIARTMRTKKNTRVGYLEFEYRKPFLMMWLPGYPERRPIYYYMPRMLMRKVHTGRMVMKQAPRGMNADECYFMHGCMPGEEYEEEETYEKLSFTYLGKHQKTRQWVRIDSHGGRTTEQATQGSAREVLAHGGLLRAHRDGFNLRSHVHDEAIAMQKISDRHHTGARLRDLMKQPLPAFPGLPLGASFWEGPIYWKD